MASIRFLFRLSVSTVIVSLFFILSQDFHIFPGLIRSKLFNISSEAPEDVIVHRLTSGVPVWEVEGENEYVFMLFHGNADSLDSFLGVQRWLQSLGYGSFSVEFRGYDGKDSGWPTEAAFHEDAREAFELGSEKKIILGSSLGTSVASWLAWKKNTEVLILIAPFYNLEEAVRETPLLGLLSPFLIHEFSSDKWISSLGDTCVVNIHGEGDGVIPFIHSKRLQAAYTGTSSYFLEIVPGAGHNDVLARGRDVMVTRLNECLGIKKRGPS